MPKGYWIGRVDVADPEAFQKYLDADKKAIVRYGGKVIVLAGKFEAVEGQARARNIVVEFPSYQDALDCYNCPDYQAVLKLRLPPAATSDFIVIEGHDRLPGRSPPD